MVPVAQSFIEAYDGAAKYLTQKKTELREGHAAVAELAAHIRSWAPIVRRDVPALDTSALGDKPNVPDDVMLDAETLLSAASGVKSANGDPAPYFSDLEATLGGALQKAEKEWAEAEAADSTYQSLLATARETSESFNKGLVGFRRTLAAVAGRQDKDFQKLRAELAGTPDEDDDDEPEGGGAGGGAGGARNG